LIYIKAVNRISSTPPNRIIITEKKTLKKREPNYLPSTTSPYFEKASLKLCSSVENETPETERQPIHKPSLSTKHRIRSIKGINSKGRSNAPPINSLELGAEDRQRIAWKKEGDERSSELTCLLAVCLNKFPILPKKAIAAEEATKVNNSVQRITQKHKVKNYSTTQTSKNPKR